MSETVSDRAVAKLANEWMRAKQRGDAPTNASAMNQWIREQSGREPQKEKNEK